jgi:hypothetical protein
MGERHLKSRKILFSANVGLSLTFTRLEARKPSMDDKKVLLELGNCEQQFNKTLCSSEQMKQVMIDFW